MRVLRLLVVLLVTGPVVMTMADVEASAHPNGALVLVFGETQIPDDASHLTRLGNEIDDLREVVFGPDLRFEPVGLAHAAFAFGRTDRIDGLRRTPPDRPPRIVA